jgi:hypothetical protein
MSHLQLLAFHFPPEAAFEGRLVGALERMESGGALRILDTLFVASEPGTGELLAVATHGSRLGGEVASLLRFRLEPAARKRATERALAAYARAGAPNPLEAVHARLEPGAAVAAALVEHVWRRALDDAIASMGGRPVADDRPDAAEPAALADALVAALPGPGAHGG